MIREYFFEGVQASRDGVRGKATGVSDEGFGCDCGGSNACSTMPNPSGVSVQSVSTVVFEAIHYIEEHFGDANLTVERVARHLNVSANHLTRSFQRETGRRMFSFITLRRIEHAKALLSTTDWQIRRIAHRTGHANVNWFGYLFQAVTGQTPKAYRAGSRALRRVSPCPRPTGTRRRERKLPQS